MAIYYDQENRIFTLHTKHTTYQMKVDKYGFLLHLYYGGKIQGNADYLLTFRDRGFSGNPHDAGPDRTYSLDALPQDIPVWEPGITAIPPLSSAMRTVPNAVIYAM